MKKAIPVSLIFTAILICAGINETVSSHPAPGNIIPAGSSDTLQSKQQLYRGLLWTNKYRRFEGDQFFLTQMFLTGSVSVGHRTFNNVRLKYDIYSDELITPINMEEIIQLNREMIDSFSLRYENKTYRFINFQNDSVTGFNGYYNLLYSGESFLYARYQKRLSAEITTKSDGEFIQQLRVYVVTGNNIYQVKNLKDFFRITGPFKDEIRNYISSKKLKIIRNDPESYIPVLEYYDSISN